MRQQHAFGRICAPLADTHRAISSCCRSASRTKIYWCEGPCKNTSWLITLPAMSESCPQTRRALTRTQRLLLVLLGAGIVVVFGIAGWCQPDPRGYGTHEQLGMPPCTFRELTGVNCPHCGLTTSFSWFVRGKIGNSMQANPAGLILASASVVIFIWSVVVSLRGAFIILHEPGRCMLISFVIWVLFSVIVWFFRLF
ncbi:MAG: DUF2752 domain-containing protein [Planctomycetota bacterium]|nr:MAG: DUF2752 domain-containing protein [Planctomycetota bacterium]